MAEVPTATPPTLARTTAPNTDILGTLSVESLKTLTGTPDQYVPYMYTFWRLVESSLLIIS